MPSPIGGSIGANRSPGYFLKITQTYPYGCPSCNPYPPPYTVTEEQHARVRLTRDASVRPLPPLAAAETRTGAMLVASSMSRSRRAAAATAAPLAKQRKLAGRHPPSRMEVSVGIEAPALPPQPLELHFADFSGTRARRAAHATVQVQPPSTSTTQKGKMDPPAAQL